MASTWIWGRNSTTMARDVRFMHMYIATSSTTKPPAMPNMNKGASDGHSV